MSNAHLPVGMVLVGVTVGFLVVRYFSRKKAGAFRSYGWIGLAMLILFEVLLFLRVGWVGIYFTPLCWTAYLLLTDAAVFSLKGSLRLTTCACRTGLTWGCRRTLFCETLDTVGPLLQSGRRFLRQRICSRRLAFSPAQYLHTRLSTAPVGRYGPLRGPYFSRFPS